jgi:4-hydroxy-3-methylbut-2-en-1-yl diphosphate reductase
MGVRRALSLCRQAVQKKNFPLRTLGPIIHNTTVIDELESSGIKSVKDPSQIEKGDYVLIRTHGVTPQVRQELMDRGAKIIDATCPKVARVQGIIRKNVAGGYFIVIIGDHGHAETQGLLGYAEDKGQVLSTRKEVEAFIASKGISEKICVVAQTTQELEVFNDLCSILNSHFKDIKIIDTICDATRNRQEEIRHKARGSSSIFVVGGKNSANTTRLYEIAKKICPNTYHIERADEIDAKKISDDGKVFVTAGASTPMWVAHEIMDEVGKRSLFNIVLRITGSKYAYWVCALLAIVMTYYVSTSEQGLRTALLLLGGAVFASRGMSYYYMKRLDVIRLDYFYGRIALAAGLILLALVTVFFSHRGAFFLLYYCILFYVVYKNIAVGRNFFFTLCNLVFLTVPLVAL